MKLVILSENPALHNLMALTRVLFLEVAVAFSAPSCPPWSLRFLPLFRMASAPQAAAALLLCHTAVLG